jgi:hypothetical protein
VNVSDNGCSLLHERFPKRARPSGPLEPTYLPNYRRGADPHSPALISADPKSRAVAPP